MRRRPQKVLNLASGGKTSDRSGLKVDGNCLKCLEMVQELTTFIVQYIDRLLVEDGWRYSSVVRTSFLGRQSIPHLCLSYG